MEPWTASTWAIILLVGASIIVNVVWRLVERLIGYNRPARECADWLEQVRKVLVDMIEVEIDKHTLQARLVKLLGSQPPDYDGLAQEAFARTLLLNPALAAKAEQVGLFAPGTFGRIGVPTYDTFNPAHESAAGPPQLTLVTEPPETVWVGTVQVAKDKRANGAAN